MVHRTSRAGYLLELLLNGAFVLIYTLVKNKKLPEVFKIIPADYYNHWAVWAAPFLVLFTMIIHFRRSESVEDFIRKYVFSLIILIPMLITLGDPEFSYWLAMVHLFSTFISLNEGVEHKPQDKGRSLDWIYSTKLTPAQTVIISFGGLIIVGALLLSLPIAAQTGKTISFIDALFTATSATCVTGLATISLVDEFSLFGQIIVLALVQVGGLGFMTLSTSLALFMGKSLGVREQLMMQGMLDSSSSQELLDLIINIVKFTLLIEFVGAIILTIGFFNADFEIGQSLYLGFYHSIMAFCNAGFALFNTSLEEFKFSPLIHGTIAVLIILGGLGFSVMEELLLAFKTKKRAVDLSLHTKIVLTTNFLLLTFGATYLFFGEFLHAFADFSLWEKLQVSMFQSVTLRTAGFNSIPLTDLHPHSVYMMILLMFVGASPGSTGGGVKTTTFAVLVQSVKSTLTNNNRVEMFERTIPNTIVVRSIAIFIISLITVSTVVLIMMRVEPGKDFLSLLFETVSAFGTVGLSLGITSSLSVVGKLVISALMFIGRVGPLTLVLAVGENAGVGDRLEYPESKILIG